MPSSAPALVGLAATLSLLAGTTTATSWPEPPVGSASGSAAGPAAAAAPEPAAAPAQVAAARVTDPPLRLRIPSLGLERDLVDLGRQPGGALEVPVDPAAVGRWAGGGPGDPVVLAGHVDGHGGPAVFARLGELTPGDEVLLETAQGVRRHRVARVERHAKDAFPTFGVYAGPPGSLRLITCGGTFDRRARSYADNVVVFADPV